MIRTFRYPLYPTQVQASTLESWLWKCRSLYNGALEERINSWKKLKKGVSLFDQTKSLAIIRGEDPTWVEVPSVVARSALKRLDRAYQSFFRRVKAGGKPGFPRFQGRDRFDSFSFMSEPSVIRSITPAVKGVSLSTINIPKMGPVKFKEYRPIQGKVIDVILKREGKSWFVLFQCDLGEAPVKITPKSSIGIDLGLDIFVALSNGEEFNKPKLFRASEALLAERQRAAQRKRKGSKSKQRAKLLVRKVHAKIKNQRKDFAWKLANVLVNRFDLIVHEDLQIKNMVQGHFGKSINDAAWSQLIHCLNCKAEEAGKTIKGVDPRGTSQRCSGCGATVSKTLSQRTHYCEGCGLTLGRDHNAAINVLALGLSAVGATTASRKRQSCTHRSTFGAKP